MSIALRARPPREDASLQMPLIGFEQVGELSPSASRRNCDVSSLVNRHQPTFRRKRCPGPGATPSRSALRHQDGCTPVINSRASSVTVDPCRKTSFGFGATVDPCRERNFGFGVTADPYRKTNFGFRVTVDPCRKTNFGFRVTVDPCRKTDRLYVETVEPSTELVWVVMDCF